MAIASPPRKSRRWIWYFVVVTIMALAATIVLIVFNFQQQLRPEQLAAARKMWKEKAPANYTMAYVTRTTRVNHDVHNHFWVQVRARKVVASKFNGQPEEARLFSYRSMDGLFDDIERSMKIDSAKGSPRAFVRAIFDDQKTGGLIWYVRRVMGQVHRDEITVESFTIDP